MTNAVVKRWGNSYGVILPIKEVRTFNLSENDIIDIKITKKVKPLKNLFGTYKTDKATDEIKKELKAGWDE